MVFLYFSLSSCFLFIALGKDNNCLDVIQKDNFRLHSENFLSHLRQTLEKSSFSLMEIDEIYFTSTPSGQTGIRVSLTFLATLQVLNPKIKLYYINTLLLQAGTDNCISLLTIDSRESKYYVAIYQDKNCLLEEQLILKKDLEKLVKKFSNFLLRKDFQSTDFLANFSKLKKEFKPLEKITEISY